MKAKVTKGLRNEADTLEVSELVGSDTLKIEGDVELGSDLEVDGDVNINGTLTVAGKEPGKLYRHLVEITTEGTGITSPIYLEFISSSSYPILTYESLYENRLKYNGKVVCDDDTTMFQIIANNDEINFYTSAGDVNVSIVDVVDTVTTI